MFSRSLPAVRRRLLFLSGGNLLLLLAIRLLLSPESSFREVLARIGPDIAPVTLAGFALTGIIFTGSIDLSIGSAIALSGTVFGWAITRGAPPPVSFAVAGSVAWGILALNGSLVARLKIPAIIITLAGLPFYRGLALILAELAVPNFSGNISVVQEAYHAPGKAYPGLILLAALIFALLWDTLAKRPRLWLALGNSPEACNLIGLRPEKILTSSFFCGGVFFALAALVYVTRVQAIEPARMAAGFELQVIAAVILGGTNIFGGEGSYLGTLLGALFLYLISQLLIYAGASAYLQDAMTGAIILLIIGTDCALHRTERRMEELL